MAQLIITVPDEHVAEVIDAITEQMNANQGESASAHAERFLLSRLRNLVLTRRRRIAEEQAVGGVSAPF